jgi:calcium/calmodulin-dependent protein kinase I
VPKSLIKDRKAARSHLDFIRTLDHPHIVRLLAWFEGRKNIYSVFELARGGELFDRIQTEGPYDEDTSRRILASVLDGVLYLHKRLVVHRDVKPENILVSAPSHHSHNLKNSDTLGNPQYRSDDHSDLVIADLGFAARLKSENDRLSVKVGTPGKINPPSPIPSHPSNSHRTLFYFSGYCAPEVFSGSGYDRKVDMWAVGTILYVLLSKHFPFKSSDPDAIVRETVNLGPDFPKFSREFRHVSEAGERRESYTDSMVSVTGLLMSFFFSFSAKDLIRRLLMIDPEKRPTAEEALRDPVGCFFFCIYSLNAWLIPQL